ncbi:MAG: hypothetical protein ACPGGE_03590 [Poseidonia sp.]
MLAEEIQKRDQAADVKLALDVGKAIALPVAIGAGAYLTYLGLINMSTGIDELKNRFMATPAGQATEAAGDIAENVQRTNPTYRAIRWFFGLENEPIFTGGFPTAPFGGAVTQ